MTPAELAAVRAAAVERLCQEASALSATPSH
jgi:hypothetical protein